MDREAENFVEGEKMTVPIEVQIAIVKREIAMRKNAYPRWIANKQFGMTEAKAAHEIDGMQAVLETLQQVAERERLI